MLLIINEDHVGQRIDNFLFSHLKGVPKTRVYRMIRKGEVRVDSRRIDASFKLQIGQKIRIPPVRIPTRPAYGELNDENSIDFLEIEKKIEIIDETNGLLIVNKAEGLAVHGGSGKSFGLIESLRKIKNQPNLQLVHRLDKDTSGLLLISSKRPVLLNLHRQLREGRIKKTYLACSQGKIDRGSQLIIRKPLLRFYNKKGERMVKVDPTGQHAITKVIALETVNHKKHGWISLLQCEPITGRTHQIRVHLQSKNLPIFGDQKYGINTKDSRSNCQRMFLHAWKLKFCDFESNSYKNYTADIPITFTEFFSEFKFFDKTC